jgi:hypothetical protein
MPGPFSPNDNLVGPIVQQIANLIQTQIPSINYVYTKLPDRPPQDNSVMLPLVKAKLLHEYSGLQQWQFIFAVMHTFRRRNMSDTLSTAYTYITPWMNFLGAWPNQTLGGLAEEVNATELTILQRAESGQPMVVLTVSFNVVTSLNIPLS